MYTNSAQWHRVRKQVLVTGKSIRSVAAREGMSRNTLKKLLAMEQPPQLKGDQSVLSANAALAGNPKATTQAERELQRWKDWIFRVERGDFADQPFASDLSGQTTHARKLLLAAMAEQRGFSHRSISIFLGLARNTVRKHLATLSANGPSALLARKPRTKKADDPAFTSALFKLLHEPPTLSGYNRTTWRIIDLQQALANQSICASRNTIAQAIRNAGFRWRAAKVVLTSTDPEYREKLERVQSVLSSLSDDERFFSIDEFGPFAVKAKPGRMLVGPADYPSVPQWQKSKGWLILTAALELSKNRVTHFYSRAKNTTEMIKMAKVLIDEYSSTRTLYLSWDAASWHISKDLLTFIETHNGNTQGLPRIELVPLPASAQFLNVIESVFSGMARAIVHNSDYPSVDAAQAAIDRYFAERNQHFADNPKRAGSKIWGKERTLSSFDPASNCKDAAYR